MCCLNPPIHDATCNMQLAACNRIALCVLEMLRVACSVKLLQANRIAVYSLQNVARSFKGFTGNAATEHLSRRGDLHTLIRDSYRGGEDLGYPPQGFIRGGGGRPGISPPPHIYSVLTLFGITTTTYVYFTT